MASTVSPPREDAGRAAHVRPDLRYRPDIDGLRALAVVAVVLFHAELTGFAGGYVGVDVFFVISGYLITQRVVAGTEQGTFSFWHFYTRRVRRLLPAGLMTIGVSLAVAVVVLTPAALRRMAESAAAAALSVSNVLFYAEAGYWDAEALGKPLLHTWSLAVEEQFYLVWPLLIVAVVRWGGRRALPVLAGLGVLSLGVTVWVTAADPAAAFYLMPFRVYEFVIGAVLVWGDRVPWSDAPSARLVRRALGVAGLLLVLVPVVVYSATTPFPGYAALAPALGTAAIIVARDGGWLGRLLSSRAFRRVGLVSYSLYLVHWPIIVFTREFADRWTYVGWLAFVLVATYVAAEVQYRFVEQRFRHTSSGSAGGVQPARHWRSEFRRQAAPVVAVAVVVALAAGGVRAADGFPGRYDGSVQELAGLTLDEVNEDRTRGVRALCESSPDVVCGTPTAGLDVLVIGDSHAPDGVNVLQVVAPEANLLVSSRGGCPPFADLGGVPHSFGGCADYNVERLARIEALADEVEVAVLSIRVDGARVDGMEETTAWLQSLGYEVVVLGVGPFYTEDIADVVVEHGSLSGLDAVVRARSVHEVFAADDALRRRVEALGATYVDKLDFFCDDEVCLPFVPGTTELAVFDRHHLTLEGARAYGEHLRASAAVDLG